MIKMMISEGAIKMDSLSGMQFKIRTNFVRCNLKEKTKNKRSKKKRSESRRIFKSSMQQEPLAYV